MATYSVLSEMTKDVKFLDFLVSYGVMGALVETMWKDRQTNGVQSALDDIPEDAKDPWNGEKLRLFSGVVEKTDTKEEAHVPAMKKEAEPGKVEEQKADEKSEIVFVKTKGFSPGGAKALIKDLKEMK